MMEIMESSKRNRGKVYDRIRKAWVTATQEERIRQGLLTKMIEEWHYPKELLVIEREIAELPHLIGERKKLPERRIDLLSYGKNPSGSIYPLLLVECKQYDLTDRHFEQLLGYNHYVGAPFVALINEREIRFRYETEKKTVYLSFLPLYSQLLEAMNHDPFTANQS
jgi:hypothetical protein